MKILFLSCPLWDSEVPPYNLSLLSTIVKNNGHESKVLDLNIQCYRELQKTEKENYWLGKNYFRWGVEHFKHDILPKIEQTIDKTIEDIIDYNPDFVGISVYSSNKQCVEIIIEKIKSKSDIKIMVGGPECFQWTEEVRVAMNVDLLFTGEAEEVILDALENYEHQKIYETKKLSNLNDLPFIDYGDIDLNQYESIYRRIATEASRGCVSKCSFCSETCFWGYRFKDAQRMVDELEHYVNKYNINRISFNDSLINGNIKEFKRFVNLLAERNLGIKWGSYYRINKKMDMEFFKKAREAGNIFMSFGIESGSQKVLNDMKKNIQIDEIENNLRDAKLSGIKGHVNWIVGFPTETSLDNLKSLIFLYNNKDNIGAISPGMTCGIAPNSDLQKNPGKYDITRGSICSSFTTKEGQNTIIHRFIRLKLTHIWLDIFDIFNSQKHSSITKDYELYGEMKDFKRIDYEKCYDCSHLYTRNFQSSLICEFLSFFWGIYQTFGIFKMTLKFDYINDREYFNTSIVAPYNADVSFQVNKNSSWILEINHELKEDIIFNENKKIKGRF